MTSLLAFCLVSALVFGVALFVGLSLGMVAKRADERMAELWAERDREHEPEE